jgi:hypothetical protein
MPDAFRTPETRKHRDAVVAELKRRMEELRPVLAEYETLQEMRSIIEAATDAIRKERGKADKSVPWTKVTSWFLANYMPTDSFKSADLRIAFDKSTDWASARTKKLLEEGYLESWGNGLLRRPARNERRTTTVNVGNQTIEHPVLG